MTTRTVFVLATVGAIALVAAVGGGGAWIGSHWSASSVSPEYVDQQIAAKAPAVTAIAAKVVEDPSFAAAVQKAVKPELDGKAGTTDVVLKADFANDFAEQAKPIVDRLAANEQADATRDEQIQASAAQAAEAQKAVASKADQSTFDAAAKDANDNFASIQATLDGLKQSQAASAPPAGTTAPDSNPDAAPTDDSAYTASEGIASDVMADKAQAHPLTNEPTYADGSFTWHGVLYSSCGAAAVDMIDVPEDEKGPCAHYVFDSQTAEEDFSANCTAHGGYAYTAEEWNAKEETPQMEPGEFRCQWQ